MRWDSSNADHFLELSWDRAVESDPD